MSRVIAIALYVGGILGLVVSPVVGAEKSVSDRARQMEVRRAAINYCLENLGKSTREIDISVTGKDILVSSRITFGIISWQYDLYGDYKRAADYAYKDWLNYRSGGLWEPLDEGSVMEAVIAAYEKGGMYKELLTFYPQAYKEFAEQLAMSTDIHLLKTDFEKYRSRWPEEAARYLEFMDNWKKTKRLSATTKPKPLAPTVQNHEWFYSDRQEEVLAALDYYFQNKVQFMLEKAVSHKDPVVAAKAKEYLETLKKGEKNETENKKP